ncbi:MAG: hypothetical protein M0R00_01390 [Candidatus Omnitrophica bacterium]|jgi:hypothetical protein|nr:hypothetical protein [Candidatus Omnitrophota bacterium]
MAATAYTTDCYKASTVPDSNVPAGVVLAQFTSFTANASVSLGDTIYFARLPKNAVLVDILMQFPAGSSVTFSLGTVTYSTGVTVGAANIASGVVCTGAGRVSLMGGFQGSTLLSSAVLQTVGPGTKFTVDTGLLFTNAGAALTDDDVIYFTVLYFMDYGADMATDAG